MNNGWVKLYRKINDNDIIGDATALQVFIWVITNVDRTTGKVKVGRFFLSNILNLNPSTFYKALKRLEKKYKVVTLDSNNKFTMISLIHWAKYQSNDDVVTQSGNNKVTTKEQQSNTLQEYKNREVLTNVNRTSPFGSEEINILLGEFEKRLGRIPADKYPRKVAQNSRQVINGFIKRKGELFKKIRGSELTFTYVLERSWDWYMSKDYATKTEKLDSYHARLKVFVADKEKQLELEGRRLQ